MVVPSIAIDVHDRFTPSVRDRISEKLQIAVAGLADSTYRMLTPDCLRRLAEIDASSAAAAPVLSLYLQLTPERRVGRAWHTAFSSLAKEALHGLEKKKTERVAAEEALDRIEQALVSELPALGRGAAFFAARELGLWQQIAISLPLPDSVYLSPRPHIRPLVRTLDEHDRFVLAILTRATSRFFISQIGLIEEVFRVTSDHHRPLLADRPARDSGDEIVAQALGLEGRVIAHVMGALAELVDSRHIVVAGAPDLRSRAVSALPKALVPNAQDEFAAEVKMGPREVAVAAEPTLRAIEEREETQTLQRMIEAGPQGAAWGEGATLAALREGRVMILAVDDTVAIAGTRCRTCDSLDDAMQRACSICGSGDLEAVDDLVELVIERGLEQKATIEIVRSDGARQLMGEQRRMGALLRW